MSISFDKKAEVFVWQMYGRITGKFAVFKFLLKMETFLCGKRMANENILVFLEINCPAFVWQMTGTMVALRMLGFAKTSTNVIADSPYALFLPKGKKNFHFRAKIYKTGFNKIYEFAQNSGRFLLTGRNL